MVCDGGGRKIAELLATLGLVFIVVCECHNLNKMAEQYSVGFGEASTGSIHPYNLCFELVNLVRNTCGIEMFFFILAAHINQKFREHPGIGPNVSPFNPTLFIQATIADSL